MNFNDYIATTDKNQKQIASELGISESYLSKILNGRRTPSIKMLHRIKDMTEGKVTIDDFKI